MSEPTMTNESGRPTGGELSDGSEWAGDPFWRIFLALGAVIAIGDQATKALIVGSLELGRPVQVVGDWIRFTLVHNSGGLFGIFVNAAPVFAVFSLVVIGIIVAFHARSGRNLPVSVALGLLLGGAIGNLIDRVRFGWVNDFVDMGIGDWRFYTYNLADAAITAALITLIVATTFPELARRLTPDA